MLHVTSKITRRISYMSMSNWASWVSDRESVTPPYVVSDEEIRITCPGAKGIHRSRVKSTGKYEITIELPGQNEEETIIGYDMMMEFSNLFDTRKINLRYNPGHSAWSEWTGGEDTNARIIIEEAVVC